MAAEVRLTHFMPLVSFSPLQTLENPSGGIERDQWHKMGHWIINIALTLICIKCVPGDPSTIFLATIFTEKMPESSGPCIPLF